VSFTFDDFPRTARQQGAGILEAAGARGTFFVSFGLLGQDSVSGPIVTLDDLRELCAAGHELGCHTFHHLDGKVAGVGEFVRSIEANRTALQTSLPGQDWSVFAYPLDGPVLGLKTAVGPLFTACRGGGQQINSREIDLNLLHSYFLDARTCGDLQAVRELLARNARECGWLIFSTHDVAPAPSRYGCDPGFFGDVVAAALASGARVLPMGQVCRQLCIPQARPSEATARP
jgi:hypothetical protein